MLSIFTNMKYLLKECLFHLIYPSLLIRSVRFILIAFGNTDWSVWCGWGDLRALWGLTFDLWHQVLWQIDANIMPVNIESEVNFQNRYMKYLTR